MEREQILQLIQRSKSFWSNSQQNLIVPTVEKGSIDEFTRFYKKILNEIQIKGVQWEKRIGLEHSCKKGCAKCCIQSIEIFTIEALTILDYLEKINKLYLLENISTINMRIKSEIPAKLLNSGKSSLYTKYQMEYMKLAILCPFVESGKCAIYPVRPINCAIYHSYGSAKDCMKNNSLIYGDTNYIIYNWPLEPWSTRILTNFFLINNSKFDNIQRLMRNGSLTMIIEECMKNPIKM